MYFEVVDTTTKENKIGSFTTEEAWGVFRLLGCCVYIQLDIPEVGLEAEWHW
jgi:hypothetical protein